MELINVNELIRWSGINLTVDSVEAHQPGLLPAGSYRHRQGWFILNEEAAASWFHQEGGGDVSGPD